MATVRATAAKLAAAKAAKTTPVDETEPGGVVSGTQADETEPWAKAAASAKTRMAKK